MVILFLAVMEDLIMNNKTQILSLYLLLYILFFQACKSKIVQINKSDLIEKESNINKGIIAGNLQIELVDSISYFKLKNKYGCFSGRIVDSPYRKGLGQVLILREIESNFIPISSTNEIGYFEVNFKLLSSNRFAFYLVGYDTLIVNLINH
jgi:hypothetical protein